MNYPHDGIIDVFFSYEYDAEGAVTTVAIGSGSSTMLEIEADYSCW